MRSWGAGSLVSLDPVEAVLRATPENTQQSPTPSAHSERRFKLEGGWVFESSQTDKVTANLGTETHAHNQHGTEVFDDEYVSAPQFLRKQPQRSEFHNELMKEFCSHF